jgi:hypothetical protein
VLVTVVAAVVGAAIAAAVAAQTSDPHPSRKTIAAWSLLALALVILLIWRSAAAFATITAVLGFAGLVNLTFLADALPAGKTYPGQLLKCPGAHLNQSLTGQIRDEVGKGGAPVRTGASIYHTHAAARYPAGCALDFTSFCIGPPVPDRATGAPNTVWLRLDGSQRRFLAGADVQLINQPVGQEPSPHCSHALVPRTPTLLRPTRRSVHNHLTLSAAALNAQVMGFAVRYDSSPNIARWHAAGVDTDGSDGFSVGWDTRVIPPAGRAGTRVIVAAVPCYAVDFAARVQTTRRIVVNAKQTSAHTTHPPDRVLLADKTLRIHAREEACRTPGR